MCACVCVSVCKVCVDCGYELVLGIESTWYVCVCVFVYVCAQCAWMVDSIYYGVATVSRIDSIIGLFCRKSSLL